ncbi:unnamed protein product, partial [Symbiodinium sp. CCMP2456]
MARSTFVVAVVMLMLPATARRNKDDLFTMEAGNSEARDLQAELESWLSDRWGVGLSTSDAQWWARKESWYMETCGATLPYLKKLYSVLNDRFKMAYSSSKAVELMFAYAKKQFDPDQLFAMYSVLVDRFALGLSQEEARSRAPELLEKDAASAELGSLYSYMVDRFGAMRLPQKDAQKMAMELAAAGCEPIMLKKFATEPYPDKQRAADEAVMASFDMQAYRYAEDGKYYTASQFKNWFGSNWMAKWMASPVAQKVAEDGKAYSASQFRAFFGVRDWLSKWNAATWATQRRIAEDGKVYTLDEFVSYFGQSQWQQKWAKAP